MNGLVGLGVLVKTDLYLYDGIGYFYEIIQKMLAKHKIKRGKKALQKLCSSDPKYRDIERYVKISKAIRFWEESQDW